MAKLPLEDATLLAAALEGLQAQRARIDEQIARVTAALGGKPEPAPAAAPKSKAVPRKKHRLSEAGRERIAEAQRRRWEAARQAKAEAAKAAKKAKKKTAESEASEG